MALTGPVGVVVGAGVAAAVYGVKVGAGLLAERNAVPEIESLPMPAKGSPAEVWLRRAERAVRTLHEQTETPPDPAIRDQIGDVDDRAGEMLGELRRLASQVASVDQAVARIDRGRIGQEQVRLQDSLRLTAEGPLREEQLRAAASVEDQLAVYRRLTGVRDTLVARMQTTALGMEGLIARLAEVIALASTSGGVDTTAGRILQLGDELDGMRSGLAETEALSRQVLGSGTPPAP